jgi:hypothetical protein
MSDWYARTQGATTLEATHNGEAWSADEIETVIAFTDTDTDANIALALGRTMAAVWNIQFRLRTEGVDTVRRAYAPAPAPRTCDTHHIALTATGDCDWC